jgi:Flp pilus assembly protein TadD
MIIWIKSVIAIAFVLALLVGGLGSGGLESADAQRQGSSPRTSGPGTSSSGEARATISEGTGSGEANSEEASLGAQSPGPQMSIGITAVDLPGRQRGHLSVDSDPQAQSAQPGMYDRPGATPAGAQLAGAEFSANPQSQFAPSNARTQDGNYIKTLDFPSSTRCSGCHHDTAAFWSHSLHRNAAREPFYRESVDILLRQRGVEPTRHCESCHTPVALFSGALSKDSGKKAAPFTALDDEGVTCTVCHSIVEARLDGTGSYTIRRPALLAKEDGTPIFGDFTDEQILADIPAHKRAVMRPLLRTPEFCATCHKVTAPPDLNGYKQIKGFSAYDDWQQSGASLESVLPYYRRDARADCRTCHMARVPSSNDRAAKNGMIASHQWLGANTAAPLFYNQTDQAEAIERFLRSKVLDLDIFAIKRDSTGEQFAPLEPLKDASNSPWDRPRLAGAALRRPNSGPNHTLDDAEGGTNTIAARPGEEVTVEVVVSNRGAAHTFPPEVRDLYEAWVQFEALDASGKPVFQSGLIKPDSMLDEGAHVYKTIIVDQDGRIITRHQIWRTNIKAYDNAVPPGRSDVVRYRFRIPAAPAGSGSGPGAVSLTLRARVNYRRFNQEFTSFVLGRRGAKFDVPIVEMARAESQVVFDGAYDARVALLPVSASSPGSARILRAAPGRGSALNGGERGDLLPLLTPAASPLNLGVGGGLRPRDAGGPSGDEQAHLSRRWNDYGIGLLEQAQYGPATVAFVHAAEADPSDANPLVSAAIASLKTERFGEERVQFAKAVDFVTRAMKIDPANLRARYYLAWIMRAQGKPAGAVEIWEKLAAEYPRDREVARQLGQTLLQMGETDRARAAFEAVIAVDPQDASAYQYLASIYASLGRKADSDRAMALYHQFRDDPMARVAANRFYQAHPEWSDERISSHVHGAGPSRRSVATGMSASPY